MGAEAAEGREGEQKQREGEQLCEDGAVRKLGNAGGRAGGDRRGGRTRREDPQGEERKRGRGRGGKEHARRGKEADSIDFLLSFWP